MDKEADCGVRILALAQSRHEMLIRAPHFISLHHAGLLSHRKLCRIPPALCDLSMLGIRDAS